MGWQRAIAHLGVDQLAPLVEKAFYYGWIDRELVLRDFHNRLRVARQVAEPTAVFDSHIREDGRLDNAVRHMSGWAAFRPEEDRMPRPGMALEWATGERQPHPQTELRCRP